jgi:tRNA(adenine34) deaminase
MSDLQRDPNLKAGGGDAGSPEPTAADLAMMARALELAKRAAAIGEVPVGAVVYRGEQVLAEAHNRRELDCDPTAHAEMIALRAAAAALGQWRLDECSVAVTLEPCPMCAGAMVNARVARLVYGAADPKMGCVRTLHSLCNDPRFNHRIEVIAGIDAEACGRVLQEFFQARRGAVKLSKPAARGDG